MTKFSKLSLSVLTTAALAGSFTITSLAAGTYRIPNKQAVLIYSGDCSQISIPGITGGINRPAVSGGESFMPIIPENDSADQNIQNAGAYEKQVLELVNRERAKTGLAPLALSSPAQSAADIRAREIQTSFSHTRPGGRDFSTALTEAGVNFRSSGENIAYGQQTPEHVMDGWMNSPGHRANILNPDFTSIGIGYAQNSSGTGYWVQLFYR